MGSEWHTDNVKKISHVLAIKLCGGFMNVHFILCFINMTYMLHIFSCIYQIQHNILSA